MAVIIDDLKISGRVFKPGGYLLFAGGVILDMVNLVKKLPCEKV